MSSAARSSSATAPPRADVLSGPVAVCVDRPLLALDRSFTYELPEELGAGVGSLVRVRFHGSLVRGWVLGPTDDLPARTLKVHALVSPVRFFDERRLELYRWMARRYVAPLASVLERSSPPRVASEDSAERRPPSKRRPTEVDAVGASKLTTYRHGAELLDGLEGDGGTFVVRCAPGDDAALAIDCVAATLGRGRSAIVLVPEVDPLPATVAAILSAFGDDAIGFYGGDRRRRYRTWLDISAGAGRVVVGTRAAVFAPLADVGLLFVAREHHALHREERSPYFHVRDVAVRRAQLEGAACVMASVMPSLEALATEHVAVEPVRRTWPRVEVVRPGPEGRAPTLVRALGAARRGFLYEPMRGYGVARVCRACGEAAACAACGGVLRSEEGAVRCVVCEAEGRCAGCGASDFGLARGGVERVEEWAGRIAPVPVRQRGSGPARAPGAAEILVGGIDAVKDLGTSGLDLVAVLNADASLRRPGISARAQALSTWAEVAAWASPDGRVIVQSDHVNDPAVQSLVAGKPDRFARSETPRLADAGFPVGAPVFRVVGSPGLGAELETLPHRTLLVSAPEGQEICLVALDPGDVESFGNAVRRLAERGIVSRVEAEPHL